MSTVFPISLDDSIVMAQWGLGVHRPHDKAQRVFVSLLLANAKGETCAVSILNPEQVREMANGLLKMADEAERETLERSAVPV